VDVPGLTTDAEFRRWRFWRRWFGQRSEKAAAKFLRTLGWRILGANIHDGLGELDLIACDRDADGESLVIVEVRSTSQADPQVAAATVDLRKQRRLTRAALRFLGRHRLHGVNLRFDVLALAWPPTSAEPTILHIRQAFEPNDRFQMFS